VKECFLSAGGVSPTPLFLIKTNEYLKGKTVCAETLIKANEIMQSEISPISDVRGSVEYKRLLLRQLFFAHFIKLFPSTVLAGDLLLNTDMQ
jgi:xanthine dehydrogenase small subunit